MPAIDRRLARLEAHANIGGGVRLVMCQSGEEPEQAWERLYPGEPFSERDAGVMLLVLRGVKPEPRS